MIFSKALHRKTVEDSFKTTTDGEFIFFPRLRPKIFQAYVIPDEQTREDIFLKFEKRRKYQNIMFFVLAISGAILGTEIGYLFALLIMAIPWFAIHRYWRNKIANIFSQLEVYEGPDSLSPL